MPRSSRSWRLALALLLAVAAGLAWSGYWAYSQARIQDEVARHEARLQARGGAFTCDDRQWQGFPLRVALTCRGAILGTPDGTVVEGADLEASAPAYKPGRVDAVATGPMRIRLNTGEALAIDHTPARLHVQRPPIGQPKAVLAVERLAGKSSNGWSFGGRNIAVEGFKPAADRITFAASGEALSLAHETIAVMALDSLVFGGRIEAVPHIAATDLNALLDAAAQRGSRLTLETFEARFSDVVLTASGTIRLAATGPTGTITTTVSNLDAFLADLERRGVISDKAVQAATLLIGLLQGKRDDGKVSVDLRLHEGRVFWGPFAIADIPPLR